MLDEQYGFRERLVDRVVRDLVGPSAPDEIVSDAPLDRYISGILYPRSGESVDAWNDVDVREDDADVDEAADPPVTLANVRYPSSIGLTFSVVARIGSIRVEVEAGRYEAIERDPTGEVDAGEGDPRPRRRRRGEGPSDLRWSRSALHPQVVDLDVGTSGTDRRSLGDGLELFWKVRESDGQGVVSVTLALINTNGQPSDGMRDPACIFQPTIRVGAEGAFVERRGETVAADDDDLASYSLLYRHARAFAVGHGCAVDWAADDDAETASAIWTTFTPTFDLNVAESNQDISSTALSLAHLAAGERSTLAAELESFVGEYETWIAARRDELVELPAPLASTGRRHLDLCKEATDRMRAGIALLGTDEDVWRAFRLANAAMHQQRSRISWIAAGCPAPGPDLEAPATWRPFQLGFLLLCLPGIVDGGAADREIADLLWFPTGGGKTEAYLGLIAFTAFLRRLRGRGGGVTALMRYTLRLLTIQQFDRASLLICCCEDIRRTEEGLGDDPFSIGLWVGQDGTPNDLAQARRSLDALRTGQPLQKANPVQLHACPWCGSPLDHRNYWIATNPRRLVVGCRTTGCEFGQGLPVLVVDEDIYSFQPTLLIATADKFAAIAWRERVAELFNLDDPDGWPPELIIQDELHLISGPLGTLAGLYETAVDVLATKDGVAPKVIASTATIRRAGSQAEALFSRTLRQFPPPGLDARDSFFAVEAPADRVGTRRYVGLMAPGTSQSTLMIRTYAALLQGAADLAAPDDAVRDPYWTLVGYFNSLRVLGGARMQVQDDVNDRLELLSKSPRQIDERIELTSREPSGNIPDHLKHLAATYPDPHALDVVLATNMISVGVDIDRLGLMVLMGQPQSTSEYIQATSRVGRRHPGLVAVLFNSARSRDRSHYESFAAYHSALYREVESTSVTPFSARARDRGLHAVLVALARMQVPALRPNEGAARAPKFRPELELAVELIAERVARISPDEVYATRDELNRLVRSWISRAEADPVLRYSARDREHSLLVDAADADEPGSEDALPTLWSLRDVDRASGLHLVSSAGGARS